MSMTAQALEQARTFLQDGAVERITLLRHIKEQGKKITELEREVQKQMTLRDQAEQALADALSSLRLPISLSHQILPEFREYERGSTVALNAYLAPRMQQVVTLRFGLGETTPKTLEEVGLVMGITRERVRQLEARALRELRTIAPDLQLYLRAE